MKSKLAILVVAVVAIFFVFTAAYVVDETEQVVVTQFGKVIGKPKTEPGFLNGMVIQARFQRWIKPISGWMHLPDGELLIP